MKEFLEKFLEYLDKAAKTFQENNAKLGTLNNFLYEYEVHSVQTYGPQMNQYMGNRANMPTQQQLPDNLLLFENSKNANLKEEFNNLNKKIINPFI